MLAFRIKAEEASWAANHWQTLRPDGLMTRAPKTIKKKPQSSGANWQMAACQLQQDNKWQLTDTLPAVSHNGPKLYQTWPSSKHVYNIFQYGHNFHQQEDKQKALFVFSVLFTSVCYSYM